MSGAMGEQARASAGDEEAATDEAGGGREFRLVAAEAEAESESDACSSMQGSLRSSYSE